MLQFKQKPQREIILWTVALLIGGAAVLPLWESGALLNTRGGGDSPFLLQRVHQMVIALQDGHFPVRWMPDANYGYGYPFFNYYAPLSIYIAAFFRLIGFTFTRSIQLAQLAGFLAASAGVFGLVRSWGWRDWQALVATAAYTTAPFHLVNVYVRGDSLAEFWAMAFYPLTLWAAERLLRRDSFSAESLLPLAFSYAALVLSHNISALIFTPFLGLYILYRALMQPNRLHLLGRALLAGIIGLALSTWFWLPALLEQLLVQLGPVTEGYFHYSGHFLDGALTQSTWRFNYDVTTTQNPFRMGRTQAVLIGLALVSILGHWAVALRSRQISTRPQSAVGHRTLFLILAFALATSMLISRSTVLWEHVPLLSFTQFPWRFLSVQALFGALLIGKALPAVPRWTPPIAIGLIGVLFWSAFGGLQVDFLRLHDEDVSAEMLAQYEWFTGNIGTTISAEYLPLAVRPRLWTSPQLQSGDSARVQLLDGVATAHRLHRQTQRQVWAVTVETPTATVVLPLLHFDGWTARDLASDEPLPLHTAPGSGLAQLVLPHGEHQIELRMRPTPLRRVAEMVTLVALLATVVVGRRTVWANRRIVLWGGAGFLVLLLVARLGVPAPANDRLQSWDFAQMAYLNRAEAIVFANGNVLEAVLYEQVPVMVGETMQIITQWSPTSVGNVTLSLTTPAQLRQVANRPVPLLVSQTVAIKDGQAIFELPIPANAPINLYLPQLAVTDDNGPTFAETDSGLLRDVLYLKPLRLVAPAPQRATAAAGIEAQVVDVTRAENGDLLVEGRWRTPQPLDENYQATWRVYDRFGRFYAELDSQPGYGYLPTSSWPPNRWVDDWLQLRWLAEDGIPPFTMVATLYRVQDDAIIYQERVADLSFADGAVSFTPRADVVTLPPNATPVALNFGDQIGLQGYVLEQTEGEVVATFYWEALQDALPAYRHFVHLVDVTTGEIVAQHDAEPRFGTYPTTRWQSAELVDDLAVLYLHDVPSGTYELHVGLYQNLGDQFPRQPVFDTDGTPLQDAKYVLPTTISKP